MSEFPLQPTLPAEGVYTDLERLFIEEQPKNLWPTNQNSNLGVLRKTLTGKGQEAVDDLVALMQELFIATSTNYLGLWESQLGIPRNTQFSSQERRAIISARFHKGPFTRTRRKQVVESHITVAFGEAPTFTPAGIPITAGGIPLLAEGSGSITSFYTIVEDIPNFSYQIQVDNNIGVDQVSLIRELRRITPAGITFSVSFYNGTPSAPPTALAPALTLAPSGTLAPKG